MVLGGTIICKYCKSRFWLKVQLSFADQNNIRIHCPNCRVVLRGTFQMSQGGKIEFENASIEGDVDRRDQVILVSSELPIIYKSNVENMLLTPFMMYQSEHGTEGLQLFGRQYEKLVSNRATDLADVKDLIDFIVNGNLVVACQLISSKYSANRIDPASLNSIDEVFKYVPEVLEGLFDNIIPKGYKENIFKSCLIDELITPLEGDMVGVDQIISECKITYSFERDYVSVLKLLARYVENIEPFLPLMILSNDFGPRKETIPDNYKITTFVYSELKDFYIEAFELLCRVSILYKATLAYIDNGSVDTHNGRFGINTLDDYATKDNGIKKDVIADDPRTNQYFQFLLNSQIRNGIGHVKTEYLPETQIIRYYPYKDNARINIFNDITLTNFAYRIHIMMLGLYDSINIIGLLYKMR